MSPDQVCPGCDQSFRCPQMSRSRASFHSAIHSPTATDRRPTHRGCPLFRIRCLCPLRPPACLLKLPSERRLRRTKGACNPPTHPPTPDTDHLCDASLSRDQVPLVNRRCGKILFRDTAAWSTRSAHIHHRPCSSRTSHRSRRNIRELLQNPEPSRTTGTANPLQPSSGSTRTLGGWRREYFPATGLSATRHRRVSASRDTRSRQVRPDFRCRLPTGEPPRTLYHCHRQPLEKSIQFHFWSEPIRVPARTKMMG